MIVKTLWTIKINNKGKVKGKDKDLNKPSYDHDDYVPPLLAENVVEQAKLSNLFDSQGKMSSDGILDDFHQSDWRSGSSDFHVCDELRHEAWEAFEGTWDAHWGVYLN